MGFFLFFLFFVVPNDASWIPFVVFLFYVFCHECKGD